MDKSETLLWSENNSSIFQLLKYENIEYIFVWTVVNH